MGSTKWVQGTVTVVSPCADGAPKPQRTAACSAGQEAPPAQGPHARSAPGRQTDRRPRPTRSIRGAVLEPQALTGPAEPPARTAGGSLPAGCRSSCGRQDAGPRSAARAAHVPPCAELRALGRPGAQDASTMGSGLGGRLPCSRRLQMVLRIRHQSGGNKNKYKPVRYVRLLSFCGAKETPKDMKWRPAGQEKTPANRTSKYINNS